MSVAKFALLGYLQSTRCLPSSLSHQIISNTPFSLSSFLSLVPFPSFSAPSDFPLVVDCFLSYHPIDKFQFFYESIGLNPSSFPRKINSLFLFDDPYLLRSVHVFLFYGFPFRKLGLVHANFNDDADELSRKLKRFVELGFRRPCIAGACLAFPWVLKSDVQKEAALLFNNLGPFLLYCKSNDAWDVFEMCQKLKVFYENATGKRGCLFVEAREEATRQNFGMEEEECRMIILSHASISDINLGSVEIVVLDILMKLLGLDEEEIKKAS